MPRHHDHAPQPTPHDDSGEHAAAHDEIPEALYDETGVGMRHRARRRMDEALLTEHAQVTSAVGRVMHLPTMQQVGLLVALAIGVNQLGTCASSKFSYSSDAQREYAKVDSFIAHQRAVNDTVSMRQNASLKDREDLRRIVINNSLILCAMASKLHVTEATSRCEENAQLNSNLRERGSRTPFEPVP